MHKKIILSLFILLLVFVTLPGPAPLAQSSPKPRLIILIAIDQMRPDYFTRFNAQMTGGLKRLYSEGIVYTKADLNYSLTATGPGHATMSTGVYPRTHGILSNEWIDPVSRKRVYCVEDTQAGKVEGEGGGNSPRNLKATGIGDWLKSASPRSKVMSVGGKDRSAVLMGGQRPDYVFWYESNTGHMVTSDYYTRELPPWAQAFNASDWTANNTPAAWTRLLPESDYAEDAPDDSPGERKWGPSRAFPHPFLPNQKASHQRTSPFWDRLILDFALEAARAEKLGQRGVADLLCIGLSATDYIGHSYGPNSHEMRDNIVRLDRAMGEFLSALEKLVGRQNILLALTADHGVMPLPEYLTRVGNKKARRIDVERVVEPQLVALDLALQKELKTDEPLIERGRFLNYEAARRAGVDRRTLERRVREGLMRMDGVEDIYFRNELERNNTPDRAWLRRYQRSYYAPRGEDFQIRFCEHCLVGSGDAGTDHGSPYLYDTHVPILFWGMELKPSQIARPVYTVDIAPTLARALGIRPPRGIDGRTIRELIR